MTVEDCEDFDFNDDPVPRSSSAGTQREEEEEDSDLTPKEPPQQQEEEQQAVGAAPAYGGPSRSSIEEEEEGPAKSKNTKTPVMLEQLDDKPLSADLASTLRSLLFGDASGRFNQAWLGQEFIFSKYTGEGKKRDMMMLEIRGTKTDFICAFFIINNVLLCLYRSRLWIGSI